VESGRFGRLTLCSAYIQMVALAGILQLFTMKGDVEARWGRRADSNQGIHAVDLLQWIAGLPAEVSAFSGTLAHTGIEQRTRSWRRCAIRTAGLGVIGSGVLRMGRAAICVSRSWIEGSAVLINDRIARWEFAEPLPEDEKILADFAGGEAMKVGSG